MPLDTLRSIHYDSDVSLISEFPNLSISTLSQQSLQSIYYVKLDSTVHDT
jgi:hypothetical protein